MMDPVPDNKKTKAILCMVGWWHEGNGIGGIFIREHVEAVAMDRSVVVVHSIVSKSRSPWPTVRVDSTEENGIPVHRIRIHTWLRRFGMFEFLTRMAYSQLIRRLSKQYRFELMHIHVRTDETEQAKAIARMLGLPILVTEHNSFYNLGLARLNPGKREAKRNSVREWFNDPRIKCVMPVSQDLADTLHKVYEVPSEKLVVIPNIAAAEFIPAPRHSSDKLRLMLAAYWRPPKDHHVFIEAMKLLPQTSRDRIDITWGGFGPHMEDIRQRCTKELTDMVISFPGYLDKPAMAKLMQQADVFVLPDPNPLM